MEPAKGPLDTYLGDGVYASFDGYHIVLDLRAQGPEKIYLEHPVMLALYKFAGRVGWKPSL